MTSLAASYISPTSFTTIGDKTEEFSLGVRVKADIGGTYVYGTVVSSVYTTTTTVVLEEPVLTSDLVGVWFGVTSLLTLVDHNHDDLYYTESEIDYLLTTVSGGGIVTVNYVTTISGILQDQIDTNKSNLNTQNSNLTALSGTVDTNTLAISEQASDIDLNTTHRQTIVGNPHNVLASQITDFDTMVSNNSDVVANTLKVTNATHTGDVTGSGVLTLVDGVVSESKLYVPEAPINGYVLTADNSTAGGIKWASVSGGGGTTQHNSLSNLDYESSGHTGFQPAGNYTTTNDLVTVSGNIVSQIPSISGLATETYVNDQNTALSGVVTTHTTDSTIHFTQATIDHGTIAGLGDDDHTQYFNTTRGDARYYTKTELNTISGSLQTSIDSKEPADSTILKDADIGSSVQSHNVVLDNTTASFTTAYETKLNNIEAGAEVNNISDSQVIDLTDTGDSYLHYHSTDRNRANHTGTQTASTISDFDTEVENNNAVLANTAKISNATHTGEVTGATTLTISDNVVDEANLKLDTDPTNGYVLMADNTKSGGMKWESTTSITTNHSTLSNLDYATSGHTGFQPAGEYATVTDITTMSGSIVSQIPSVDGLATENYVDSQNVVLSGTLQASINTKADSSVLSNHTSDTTIHFTEASINHSNINGLGSDDHTQYLNTARGDARYYTETELDNGQLDNRYHTESEVLTISGSLQNQINTKQDTGDYATLSGTGQTMFEHEFKGYVESVVNHGVVLSGTVTMEWDTGPIHLVTLSGTDILIETGTYNAQQTNSAGSKVIHIYGCDLYQPDFPELWELVDDFPTLEAQHIRLVAEYLNGTVYLSYSGGWS